MIKITFFALFLLFIHKQANACVVDLPTKIIVAKVNVNQMLLKKIKGSCVKSELKLAASLILQQSGEVSLDYITQAMNGSVQFNKDRVQVINVLSKLREDGTIEDREIVRINKNNRGPSFISVDANENIVIRCQRCNNLGPITLAIRLSNPITNTYRDYLYNAKKMIQVEAYVASRNIRPSRETITNNDFRKAKIFTDNPENLVSPTTDLINYKLVRTIKKNDLLDRQAVQKAILVRYNEPSEVTFQSSGINLKAKAIPLANGRIGETIKFKLINGGKTSAATVVAKNKLRIEL